MIDENGQCWIVLVPGMELPEYVPEGLEFFNDNRDRWYDAITWSSFETFRYPVTEAVYKAHHWCIAMGLDVPCGIAPKGYELAGFGTYGDYGTNNYYRVTRSGRVTKSMDSAPCPILRKKECEHNGNQSLILDTGNDMIGYACDDCGMVRKLGNWEASQ